MNLFNAAAHGLVPVVAIAWSLSLVAMGVQARSFEDVKKDGKIIIATEGQFAPFNYFQGSKLTGFEVDVAEAMAAKMGLKIEWKALGFDALLAGVKEMKNFPQDTDARAALITGRVDAWVIDRFVAKTSLAASPNAGMKMGDFLFVERIASAVSKRNTSLAGEVNKALAAILADGSYATISKRWFDEDIRCK